MLKEWPVPAHFTDFRYLSMNRSYMKDFLKSDYDKNDYIIVDGYKLNMYKLSQNVTYNEHREVLRWGKSDWQYCIMKD